MAVEPGSSAPNFKLLPTLADMSYRDLARLNEYAGHFYASNTMFRIGLGLAQIQPMRFKVLLHPSMKNEGLHPLRARVLSRIVHAIRHVKVVLLVDGSMEITAEQAYQKSADYAVCVLELVTFTTRELERLKVSTALPVLTKVQIMLRTILDQATQMYCVRAKVEKPT